ncbi:hypothetical protein NicSoilE8_41430 (plasmid) [Arthrobacter sp. NicSoilE8]|nr:hypothetical protein NicSoilE8_41430 [Arthrobacter sp. NicSoilE8]
MIAVVLDTNILCESPFLSRPEWSSLAQNATAWQVSLLIPDVVRMETINVVIRNWEDQQVVLGKAKIGDLGLGGELQALIDGIQERIDSYEDQLDGRLAELGAELVAVPEIPHLEIAKRAAKGIAPYQEKKKDAYRDTLIWLTLLDTAESHPAMEAWFVSKNVQDFGDLQAKQGGNSDKATDQIPRPFHQQLQREIELRGLQGRVKYATSLETLEQHFAALHGPISAEDLETLKGLVDYESLGSILSHQPAIPVAPNDLALDPVINDSVVYEMVALEKTWAFADAAGRGEDLWTANYRVDVEAEIICSRPESFGITVLTKTLRVSGTAAFTKQGEPKELQVSRVEALPNDPDRLLFTWKHWNRGVSPTFTAPFVPEDWKSSFHLHNLDAQIWNSAKHLADAANAAGIGRLSEESAKQLADAANAAGIGRLSEESAKQLADAANAAGIGKLPEADARAIADAARHARGVSLSPQAAKMIDQAANLARGQAQDNDDEPPAKEVSDATHDSPTAGSDPDKASSVTEGEHG